MSSVPCEQIWGILDGRLRHLLSMMSDCPLAFHHKKGEYICSGFFFFFFFDRGIFLHLWSLWSY